MAIGANAQKLTKVKGHGTVQQVAHGEVQIVYKAGDDKADHFVDFGAEENGEHAVEMTTRLHQRHKEYVKFTQDVQRIIVAGRKDEMCQSQMKQQVQGIVQ